MDIEERIANLDEKIQEYIEQGRKIGIFNDRNIERVVSRLERVRISVDNSVVGDAKIESDRDANIFNIKLNENRIQQAKDGGKDYFEDEVLFHEFTHAISSLYENSIETGDAYKFKKNFLKESEREDYVDDFSYIKDYMSDDEKKKFDQYVDSDSLHLAGYGWLLLDEFVAQTVAQKMVKKKYNDKGIYPIKAYNSTLSNPPYRFYSDLADYEVFTPFATNFIETMYGTKDIENFCKDTLDANFIDSVFEKFQKRPEGLEHLYKMLGCMGNIYFADTIEKGHISEENIDKRDPSHYSANKENIYNSIKEFMNIAENEAQKANYEETSKSDIVVEDYNQKDKNDEKTENKEENVSSEEESQKEEKSEENENQKKMQVMVKQLQELVEKMTKSYIDRDHSNDLKNQEEYQKIISSMVDLRVLEGGKQISKLDRMMEIRRLDATASNLVLACREYASDLKFKNDTNRSKEKMNYECENLQKYLKGDIELQNGERIIVDKNKEQQVSDDKKADNTKNPENISQEEIENDDEFKLKIRYSAKNGAYIIENTNEAIPETILKSKKDKMDYIKEKFNQENIEYIFGDDLKKAIKNCDLQLITILSEFNLDCAKHYVKTMTHNEEQNELPYSMTYDLRNIKENKNLSLFDRIKLRMLAKKNQNKNAAEIIEREALIDSEEVSKPALDEKSQVEEYKQSLSSEVSQENQKKNQSQRKDNEIKEKNDVEENER